MAIPPSSLSSLSPSGRLPGKVPAGRRGGPPTRPAGRIAASAPEDPGGSVMPRRQKPGTRRPKRNDGHSANPEPDYLLEAAQENWPHILVANQQFEDKKPVVL